MLNLIPNLLFEIINVIRNEEVSLFKEINNIKNKDNLKKKNI